VTLVTDRLDSRHRADTDVKVITFYINIENSQSPVSLFQLLYGAPQGSILGPPLFILYTTIVGLHSVQAAINLYVPVKYMRNNANVKCKRWYPAALRRAISRKRCL